MYKKEKNYFLLNLMQEVLFILIKNGNALLKINILSQ